MRAALVRSRTINPDACSGYASAVVTSRARLRLAPSLARENRNGNAVPAWTRGRGSLRSPIVRLASLAVRRAYGAP